MENTSFYTVSNIETKHQPTENSNDEILRIFNKRRPYCPSYDFKKQHLLINYQKIYNFKKFDNISERDLKRFLFFELIEKRFYFFEFLFKEVEFFIEKFYFKFEFETKCFYIVL